MGIEPGDRLMEINGFPIRDTIDYQFYSADEVLDCTFSKNGDIRRVRLKRNGETLGLDFEPMRYHTCGNRCIFCFVDQNPEGLRQSLYLKDEDYRLSFLYGNYVTLTHVKRSDLERIVEQRLSPLYVSIHATDPLVRKTLLGLKRDDGLLEKIHFLVKNDIELHGQIVLCPGINDGEVLKDSLESLSPLFPTLRSMAVVPVGLTRHRRHLPEVARVDAGAVKRVINMVRQIQKRYLKHLGEPFVYLSDEFYLMAGYPLPPLDHYGDLWQIENGVGMTRAFLTTFHEDTRTFPVRLDRPEHYIIITGALAGPALEKDILPTLRRIENLNIDVKVVHNRFYGESVTMSGLLTGRDVIDTIRGVRTGATLLLPANCLNHDGLFLDDLKPRDLAEELDRRILVLDDFSDLWSIP